MNPDAIRGCVFVACVEHGDAIYDMILLMAALASECGVVSDTYRQNLKQITSNSDTDPDLLRAVVAGLLPPGHANYATAAVVAAEENVGHCLILTELVMALAAVKAPAWPAPERRAAILGAVAAAVHAVSAGVVPALYCLLAGHEPAAMGVVVRPASLQFVGGLYGLLKFAMSTQPASTAMAVAFGAPGVSRTLASCLIGAAVGYDAVYTATPYFKHSAEVTRATEVFTGMVHGLATRAALGTVKVGEARAVRWLHPRGEPAPAGLYARSPLAGSGRATYLEAIVPAPADAPRVFLSGAMRPLALRRFATAEEFGRAVMAGHREPSPAMLAALVAADTLHLGRAPPAVTFAEPEESAEPEEPAGPTAAEPAPDEPEEPAAPAGFIFGDNEIEGDPPAGFAMID